MNLLAEGSEKSHHVLDLLRAQDGLALISGRHPGQAFAFDSRPA